MEAMGGVMFAEVYKRCYEFAGRDEFKVIPLSCPIGREFCFGGYVWIGEECPVYDIKAECEFYDQNSFKDYDCRVECNFYKEVPDDK